MHMRPLPQTLHALPASFSELPSPMRPLFDTRPAAHIDLPLGKPMPFPDPADLDRERAVRLAPERDLESDAELREHRADVETRQETALRAAHLHGHGVGFEAGFWKGARFGAIAAGLGGVGLGWVIAVLFMQIGRQL